MFLMLRGLKEQYACCTEPQKMISAYHLSNNAVIFFVSRVMNSALVSVYKAKIVELNLILAICLWTSTKTVLRAECRVSFCLLRVPSFSILMMIFQGMLQCINEIWLYLVSAIQRARSRANTVAVISCPSVARSVCPSPSILWFLNNVKL